MADCAWLGTCDKNDTSSKLIFVPDGVVFGSGDWTLTHGPFVYTLHQDSVVGQGCSELVLTITSHSADAPDTITLKGLKVNDGGVQPNCCVGQGLPQTPLSYDGTGWMFAFSMKTGDASCMVDSAGPSGSGGFCDAAHNFIELTSFGGGFVFAGCEGKPAFSLCDYAGCVVFQGGCAGTTITLVSSTANDANPYVLVYDVSMPAGCVGAGVGGFRVTITVANP